MRPKKNQLEITQSQKNVQLSIFTNNTSGNQKHQRQQTTTNRPVFQQLFRR